MIELKKQLENKDAECIEKIRALGAGGDVLAVELEPTKGKGDRQFLIVKNKRQKQPFRAQCQVLEDPDSPQLRTTFDLGWEFAGRSITLAPEESCKLLIAEAWQDTSHRFEYMTLCELDGNGFKNVGEERWNKGEKPKLRYRLEIRVLGESTQTSYSERFILRPGTWCALEMVALSTDGTVDPSVSSKVPHSLTVVTNKPSRHLLSYKTRGEEGGEQGYFALSSVYFKAYTLVIENVSWRDNPVPVYNVRASIEYQHRNGYARIVLSPATWVTRDVTHSFRSSVDIPPTSEEAKMGALVILWEDKSEARKKWALATPGAGDPKELTPGRWDVKIVLTADNCDTYSATGGFTVMPDNQIVWGEPPAFTFGYEAIAPA